MAKSAKKSAPVGPAAALNITLAMVAAATDADPFYMHVPAEQATAWEGEGFVEVNRDITNDAGEPAVRITQEGRNTLTMENTATQAPASTPAPAAMSFEIETIDAPVVKRNRTGAAGKYPFDQLPAPTAEGKVSAFFIPATAERPDPWKSLASTVSTAKQKYGTKTGEEQYKSKDEAGNEIMKTRGVYEYSRIFRITEGEKAGVKGAWVSRTK